MSYNTTWAKHKSIELEGLDCGHNIKHVPVDDNYPRASFTSSSTRVVAAGECVAMIRVPANTIILGAEFYWNDAAPAAVVAIGDPFACGRILGPIDTSVARGLLSTVIGGSCGPVWGLCGTLSKMGVEGDGCGFGYRYTCETDIVLTNLYSDANATAGGWQGSSLALGSKASTAITTGTYRLVLHVSTATSVNP